jgi:hypothetical protein
MQSVRRCSRCRVLFESALSRCPVCHAETSPQSRNTDEDGGITGERRKTMKLPALPRPKGG